MRGMRKRKPKERNICPWDDAKFSGSTCYKCHRDYSDSAKKAYVKTKLKPDVMGLGAKGSFIPEKRKRGTIKNKDGFNGILNTRF